MPSEETRRLLKTFGVAVTAYEDAVRNESSRKEILETEAEVRARLRELNDLLDRLHASASAP
jgi:hypothetical protein